MEEKTKDELIETFENINRSLEEKITGMQRHIYILEHDLRVKKAELLKFKQ